MKDWSFKITRMAMNYVHGLATYLITLQSNELHAGFQVLSRVPSEHLDEFHQVCAELVSPLQDTQHRDVALLEVVHDVARQTFHPASVTGFKRIAPRPMEAMCCVCWFFFSTCS